MKPFTEKEWEAFQKRVKEGSRFEKALGVNFFYMTFELKVYKDECRVIMLKAEGFA